MRPAELANRWLHRNLYRRYGIGGSATVMDGLPTLFIHLEDEQLTVRGWSWSHLLHQVKSLLSELIEVREETRPVLKANSWLEARLFAEHDIPVLIGIDPEDALPFASVWVRGHDIITIRGYSWTHITNRIHKLLPELVVSEASDFEI